MKKFTVDKEYLETTISRSQQRGALATLTALAQLFRTHGSVFAEKIVRISSEPARALELSELVAKMDPLDFDAPKGLAEPDIVRISQALEREAVK